MIWSVKIYRNFVPLTFPEHHKQWVLSGYRLVIFVLRGDRMCTWSRRRMRLMKWILKVWRSHRVGQGKVHWIWQTSLNWIKSVFILSGLFQQNFQHKTLLLFFFLLVKFEFPMNTVKLPSEMAVFPTNPTIRGIPQLLERLVVCIAFPWCPPHGLSWIDLPLAIPKAIPLNAQADFRTAGFRCSIFFGGKQWLSPKICRDRKVASMEYTWIELMFIERKMYRKRSQDFPWKFFRMFVQRVFELKSKKSWQDGWFLDLQCVSHQQQITKSGEKGWNAHDFPRSIQFNTMFIHFSPKRPGDDVRMMSLLSGWGDLIDLVKLLQARWEKESGLGSQLQKRQQVMFCFRSSSGFSSPIENLMFIWIGGKFTWIHQHWIWHDINVIWTHLPRGLCYVEGHSFSPGHICPWSARACGSVSLCHSWWTMLHRKHLGSRKCCGELSAFSNWILWAFRHFSNKVFRTSLPAWVAPRKGCHLGGKRFVFASLRRRLCEYGRRGGARSFMKKRWF